MTAVEICGIIICSTICAIIGITAVYQSIVNVIERYTIRKEERSMKQCKELINEIPKILTAMVNYIKEIGKEIE